MSASELPQPPYPLHESVKDKLDPEYVAFYNEYIINAQQVHYQPLAASRTSGVLIPGAGPAQPVGKIQDFKFKRAETPGDDNVRVRAFTPVGEKPADGWPVMVWYHGGGWVLGNINTENVVCTHLCARANCVVITVDYRLAPENPFPAAVHDSWEALLWIQGPGVSLLELDLSKWVVGGSSAGGNLTATMCHKAAERSPSPSPKFLKQLLIVPVTDNTAEVSNNATWKSNEFTAALPADKMLWYRRHYLPKEADWSNPEASPLLYKTGWEQQPDALIVTGELDVLRSEGEQYGEKLRAAGKKVEYHMMEGMPHPFLAMDGVLQKGKKTIDLMVEALKAAIY